MPESVLIVEDDTDIAALVGFKLQELGVTTESVVDGAVALSRILENNYDLVLLDIMLPNINGLDICQQVRQQKPEQAIIMLTSKDSDIDRIIGLELGADDYISKPFNIRELQARVRTQLRRIRVLKQRTNQPDNNAGSSINDEDNIRLKSLVIEVSKHRVTLNNQAIELTATEFELLVFFSKHPNQVFSRAQLLESIWGYNYSGYEHTVNSHINRLRGKLNKHTQTEAEAKTDSPNPPSQASNTATNTNANTNTDANKLSAAKTNKADSRKNIIETVWGVGYKLNIDAL